MKIRHVGRRVAAAGIAVAAAGIAVAALCLSACGGQQGSPETEADSVQASDAGEAGASEELVATLPQPVELYPENAPEPEVLGHKDRNALVRSENDGVLCDLTGGEFACTVPAYRGEAPYGSGEYGGNFVINSKSKEFYDSNDMGTEAAYALQDGRAPQALKPGDVVGFGGNICEGIDGGLMCWNTGEKWGASMTEEMTEFFTFE